MIGVIIGLVEFAADKASDQIYHMLDSFLSWGNSILYITFGKYWINVGYTTRGDLQLYRKEQIVVNCKMIFIGATAIWRIENLVGKVLGRMMSGTML